MTTLQGEYEPSPSAWVRDQVAEYEASGGQRANTLLDTGMPIIVVTTRGAKSGKLRKNPVMRVEHDGEYALVASKGGAPENPEWFHNLVAHPDEVVIQDGPEPFAVTVREVHGDEKAEWWERACGGLPALRRVPGEDGPPDPRLHRPPSLTQHRRSGRRRARPASLSRRPRRPRPWRRATGRARARARAGSFPGAPR